MARKARVKSSTGIYHVLVRAVSDISLFTDEEDTTFYINLLNDLQQKGHCEVYAYALFPTHLHLLIREGASQPHNIQPSEPQETIGDIMKRLASSYSYYFNVKYDHYGPIYLDRFKSNPVETRDYYLKVLDHIDTQSAETKYTSHHIPSGLASGTIGVGQESPLLDFKPRPLRVTDSKLLNYLQQNYSFTNVGEFLQRPEEDIRATIKAAKAVGGSIRQISRLTGSPFQYVFNVRV